MGRGKVQRIMVLVSVGLLKSILLKHKNRLGKTVGSSNPATSIRFAQNGDQCGLAEAEAEHSAAEEESGRLSMRFHIA